MTTRRFQVGDEVTFKPRSKCRTETETGTYYFGGTDQEGVKGKVIGLHDDVRTVFGKPAYYLTVEFGGGCQFTMLEQEFEEFDGLVDTHTGLDSEKILLVSSSATLLTNLEYQ